VESLPERRDHLVRARTQMVDRLHLLLTQLAPAGTAVTVTADADAALLRTARPRELLACTLCQVARRPCCRDSPLDRRITAVRRRSRMPSPSPSPTSLANADA
jgi:hypothetical protein